MSPRIRSFLSRPFYAREARILVQKAPAMHKAPEPPTVFREFVETLQRLDTARLRPGDGAAKKHAGSRRGNGARRHSSGNGHARPRPRGPRRYS
jgi:hypothetical protein